MKIYIVLQGPSHPSIIKFYRNLMANDENVHVVFSTWKGEEKKYNQTDDVIFSKMPREKGVSNLYLQLKSTLKGLLYLQSKYGRDIFVLKIRSDFTISNPSEFFNAFSKQKNDINFLFVIRHSGTGAPYLCDFIMGGNIEKMILLFSIPSNSYPYPEEAFNKWTMWNFDIKNINVIGHKLNPNNHLLWYRRGSIFKFAGNSIETKYGQASGRIEKYYGKLDFFPNVVMFFKYGIPQLTIFYKDYKRTDRTILSIQTVRRLFPWIRICLLLQYKESVDEIEKSTLKLLYKMGVRLFLDKKKYDFGSSGANTTYNGYYFTEMINKIQKLSVDMELERVFILDEDNFFTSGETIRFLQRHDFNLAYGTWIAPNKTISINASCIALNIPNTKDIFPLPEKEELIEYLLETHLLNVIREWDSPNIIQIPTRNYTDYGNDGAFVNSKEEMLQYIKNR